jgi:hypothetical protein
MESLIDKPSCIRSIHKKLKLARGIFRIREIEVEQRVNLGS